MNKQKFNTSVLTSNESEQIRTAIKILTNILDKYDVNNNVVTKTEFNKAFNKILEGSIQRYLNPETGEISAKKTSRIEVLNKNGNWLLDYDKKKPHFWYSYYRVYTIFMNTFSLKDVDRLRLMKSLVETQYKMKGVTPQAW